MSGIVLGAADATINKTQSLSSKRSNFIGRSEQVSIQLKYRVGSATAGVAQDALRGHESSLNPASRWGSQSGKRS